MTSSAPEARSGVAIVARNLRKSFDRGLVQALDGIDLAVRAGERVAVTGPTGCGKSTLLSLLALLDVPDAGELLLDGVPARRLRPPEAWRAANVGFVFQLHHLVPHLTVAENLKLALVPHRLVPSERSERVAAALGDLGLTGRAATLAALLSGGERQLVAVARALVVRPRLVFADEPTGSVDSPTGLRILEAILSWCGENAATLVLVTHDASVAASADRQVRMRDGRVIETELHTV